jgi:hypothetical protein
MSEAATMDQMQNKQAERMMRLNITRKNQGASRIISTKKSIPDISSAEKTLMLMAGAIMDIIGLIPGLGTLVKIAGSGGIWFWQWSRGLQNNRPWFLKYLPGFSVLGSIIPGSHTATILGILILNTSFIQNKFSSK